MRMVERGATGLVADLAPALFVAANVVFAMLIVRTLALLARGTLLPAVAPAGGAGRLSAPRHRLAQCAAGWNAGSPICHSANDHRSAVSFSRCEVLEPMPWPAS